MTSETYLILGLALGALGGVTIGWLWARQRQAPIHDTRLEEELRQRLTQREEELARTREELTAASKALATTEANLISAGQRLADQQRAQQEALRQASENQQKALADLREAFKALSADALKQTQPEFLRLANETLGKFQESAKGDLAQRQERIATLVKPLEEQLKVYQQRLAQSETQHSATLGALKKHLESLTQQSQTLSSETHQLRRVLSSNQARGRWGEETLRRVVEAAGMSVHCDFTEQAQSGDSKPDLIINLPGDRIIIVDAKVPDFEFLNALDSSDGPTRTQALLAHANKLKGTIKGLADRDYPTEFPKALDYVILFLPAESLFSTALEGDQDLMIWAQNRRILLATPSSLIAILRSVSISWQQHDQNENAQAIAQAAQELYNRISSFTDHFRNIGGGLERATRAFNDAIGSYESRIRPTGERLLSLGGSDGAKPPATLKPVSEELRSTRQLEENGSG